MWTPTLTLPLRWVLLLTLFAGLLLPFQVHACSCISGEEIFPKEGTVPPNVIFHGKKWSKHSLFLQDEQGVKVPLKEEPIGDRLVRLTPSAPLESGKRYTLEMDTGRGGAKVPSVATYTVRGEPDTRPPSPPTLADFNYRHEPAMWGTSCQTTLEGYDVRASGAADEQASAGQLATLVVSASAPGQVLALLMPDDDFIGHAVCFYNFDAPKWAGTEVALRTVDLAGNLSSPGPAVRLAKSMPLAAAMVLHTTLGRGFLVIVVAGLLGLILLVARRSTRETRA
ncbi:MAG TPA: hypothetical protein VF815_15700 [Myxococcaceae bacterium]